MAIKILHLYNNLMNLYGEYANILILQRHLSEQGLDCEITRADSCKEINFSEYDFIYIGSGTENAQKRALKDLMAKKDDFISAAKSGKVMLLTGNSFEMLGESITDASGKSFKALNLCPFETTESYKKRITGDAIFKCRFISEPFVGFINKCSQTTKIENPLFSVLMGDGNSENDKNEGCRVENVFGTHLIGPILVKNPHFAKYIIQILTKNIPGFVYKDTISPYEQGSYDITLRELKGRMAGSLDENAGDKNGQQ